MKTEDFTTIPDFLCEDINQHGNKSLMNAFDRSLFQLESLDIGSLKSLESKSHNSEKYTVKDILQHISDTERIYSTGVLLFVRNGRSYSISFNKIAMANAFNANSRRIEQLLYEIETVRRATISLYKSFTNDELLSSCICWDQPLTIAQIGYNIIAHQVHHLTCIEEKYYLLSKQAICR